MKKAWYDNSVLLKVMCLLFPPIGIYGLLKSQTKKNRLEIFEPNGKSSVVTDSEINEYIKDMRCKHCSSDHKPIYRTDDKGGESLDCCCKKFANELQERITSYRLFKKVRKNPQVGKTHQFSIIVKHKKHKDPRWKIIKEIQVNEPDEYSALCEAAYQVSGSDDPRINQSSDPLSATVVLRKQKVSYRFEIKRQHLL